MCIHEEEFEIDFSKKKFWKTSVFFVGLLTTNFDMEISIVCFSSHDELQYDGAWRRQHDVIRVSGWGGADGGFVHCLPIRILQERDRKRNLYKMSTEHGYERTNRKHSM